MDFWFTYQTPYIIRLNMGKRRVIGTLRNFKLFSESPSQREYYERITSASKSDFPFRFCSRRWVENDVVSKKFLSIWLKMIEGLDFWKGLPKSNQPGRKQKLLIFTFFDE